MMWKLIDEFDTNLGWDYVHAARNWAVIRSYGYVSFLGIEGWCFQMTKQHFGYALDSMFVKRHFGGDSNQQDDAIAQLIKSTLISRIDQIGWMDADTKRTAIEKVKLACFSLLIHILDRALQSLYPSYIINRLRCEMSLVVL